MSKTEVANEKLNNALKEANNAIKEMGKDAKLSISEDYALVKSALSSTHIVQKIADVKERSVERAKEFGAQLDENVHQRPYYYVAGAGVAGLILGILIGRKS